PVPSTRPPSETGPAPQPPPRHRAIVAVRRPRSSPSLCWPGGRCFPGGRPPQTPPILGGCHPPRPPWPPFGGTFPQTPRHPDPPGSPSGEHSPRPLGPLWGGPGPPDLLCQALPGTFGVSLAVRRPILEPSQTRGSYLRSATRSFIGISALSVILMCSGHTSVQHL